MNKLHLHIAAAQKYTDLLEQALDRNDQRAIGAALYNLRRELQTLAQLTQEEDK